MHILVVDDDPATRELLSESLRLQGHMPACCGSVEAADPMVAYVDAIICDGLRGDCFDLVVTAELAGVPIVIFTGDDDLAEKAELVGMPCVKKPAGIEALLAALERRPQAVAA